MSHVILQKPTAVELFGEGAFGNRLRQWSSLKSALDSGYKGKLAVRYKSPKGGGGPCKYNLNSNEALNYVAELMMIGYNHDHIYCNEMGPDDKLTIQGEFYEDAPSFGGYYLLYSRVTKAMREALAIDRTHHFGPGALLILRNSMTRDSYDDFCLLRNLYPDHVIEFSCYSINLGNLPRRNTIFWEVRKY